MSKTKVGGLGQGLSDDRERPESTGKPLQTLVRELLFDRATSEARGMRVEDVKVVNDFQNGFAGKKVDVTFKLRNTGARAASGDWYLERTDSWFFARHLKLSNEEIVHIMRSNLR